MLCIPHLQKNMYNKRTGTQFILFSFFFFDVVGIWRGMVKTRFVSCLFLTSSMFFFLYKNWARATAPPPMAKRTLAGVDERAFPPLGLVGEGAVPVVVLVTVGVILPEVVTVGTTVVEVGLAVIDPVEVGAVLSVVPGMGLMVMMPSPEEL